MAIDIIYKGRVSEHVAAQAEGDNLWLSRRGPDPRERMGAQARGRLHRRRMHSDSACARH